MDVAGLWSMLDSQVTILCVMSSPGKSRFPGLFESSGALFSGQ